jgi:MoxR-like ATPase
MQERQVTIGGETFPLPRPFLVLATQNPIESEGTYPLPEAQIDRFLFKLIVDYPSVGEEAAVVGRAIGAPVAVRERLSVEDLERFTAAARGVFADRDVVAYAVALADATRHPGRYGLHELDGLIEYGASPRGPIGLIQAAQALALLRGRAHVVAEDVAHLAADVLRHRLVLSYDALGDGVAADDLLDRVLETVGGMYGDDAPQRGVVRRRSRSDAATERIQAA